MTVKEAGNHFLNHLCNLGSFCTTQLFTKGKKANEKDPPLNNNRKKPAWPSDSNRPEPRLRGHCQCPSLWRLTVARQAPGEEGVKQGPLSAPCTSRPIHVFPSIFFKSGKGHLGKVTGLQKNVRCFGPKLSSSWKSVSQSNSRSAFAHRLLGSVPGAGEAGPTPRGGSRRGRGDPQERLVRPPPLPWPYQQPGRGPL
uniref:Uncharacterized protein n=1 Tax=Pipistrellus kuhlii TaxID=59472 RepID=A0A7J7U888_PIPKU|nr:hypothetical protein mPipKuh1_009184 [Pipistrellus kuhlii]